MNSAFQQAELRVYRHQPGRTSRGTRVVYWMQQAQRVWVNPALDYAILRSLEMNLPLELWFVLYPDIPSAQAKHYQFMIEGIADTSRTLKELGIDLRVMVSQKVEFPPELLQSTALLVLDHGYLNWQKELRDKVFEAPDSASLEIVEIDTEAVVPVHLASEKEEYSAATLRHKILSKMSGFLVKQAPIGIKKPAKEKRQAIAHEYPGDSSDPNALWAWAQSVLSLSAKKLSPVSLGSSHTKAMDTLRFFIREHLQDYALLRNHPELDVQSNMSAFLHFGQISPIEITMEICEQTRIPVEALPGMIADRSRLSGMHQSVANYAEELIVRRELAMNFCNYNPDYESHLSLPEWARKSLNDHLADPREAYYSLDRIEQGETDDIYWNAAQKQMLSSGKMHNYMRMYWGKRILAWFPSVEDAYGILAWLNNKYEMDGRDANGWAGIAWCFGKHDRPWAERPIYGMVRYMNAAGLKRKFDIEAYVSKWSNG